MTSPPRSDISWARKLFGVSASEGRCDSTNRSMSSFATESEAEVG